MDLDTDSNQTRQMLAEVTTDPAAVLLFALMVQHDPLLRRADYNGPTTRNRFGCYGIMGKISFGDDNIMNVR